MFPAMCSLAAGCVFICVIEENLNALQKKKSVFWKKSGSFQLSSWWRIHFSL
jgi:hypothetical protein